MKPVALALLLLAPNAALADTIRIATYNPEMTRRGPGLLIQDLMQGEEQAVAAAQVIATAAPDVIVLTGIDIDYDGYSLTALQDLLQTLGHAMPHAFAAQPNAGLPTEFDMDGNGVTGEARDAQGYGRFLGNGGMAVLSRLPLGEVRTFSDFLWRDLPGATPPMVNGAAFPSEEAFNAQRLSSVAHWDVPITLPNGEVLNLLAAYPTTPVYDGEEDRNGRRNADEIRFWQVLLDGELPFTPPTAPYAVIGQLNVDPHDGAGRREAVQALLADPRLTDPRPTSEGGASAPSAGHTGDPALDTADLKDPKPGNLRLNYVLPWAGAEIADSGVLWPMPDDPLHETVTKAGRYRLVWVDISLP